MKKILVIGLFLIFIVSLGSASACWTRPQDNYNYNFNNPEAEADATAIGVGVGGDASVKNTVKNRNNVDVDVNTTDVNIVRNRQGQLQGQLQGQIQGQGQKQSMGQTQDASNSQSQQANNEGLTQEVAFTDESIVIYEDKRQHINPAASPETDAALTDRPSFKAHTKGDLFSKRQFISMGMAKKASSGIDFEAEESFILENDFQTDLIHYGIPADGVYMGSIYLVGGNQVGLDAEAAKRAMKKGATHIVQVYSGATGEKASGDAWNIGLGGGASIISGADGSVAVAPNGGFGYGEATAFNRALPDGAYDCYFVEEMLND